MAQPELEHTQNLLKEAQANLALLEKKEATTKKEARRYARLADEYQDKYEREVVDHGRTEEGLLCRNWSPRNDFIGGSNFCLTGFCRSNGKLSALNVKLQFAEKQATEHVFKLEECLKYWEHLNEIGEQRIQQLTNTLTDTQSQNKLLLSQLLQLQQEALRAQSETVAHTEMVEKVHALNLKEKSRTEEEWQERQQELANKNQRLEVEKNPTTLTVRSKRRREETTSTSFPSSKRKKV